MQLVYQSKTDGHAFIMDGLAGIKPKLGIALDLSEYSDLFFHFTWGWGQKGDGYYLYDTVANAFGPKAYQHEDDEDGIIGWTVTDKGHMKMYHNFVIE